MQLRKLNRKGWAPILIIVSLSWIMISGDFLSDAWLGLSDLGIPDRAIISMQNLLPHSYLGLLANVGLALIPLNLAAQRKVSDLIHHYFWAAEKDCIHFFALIGNKYRARKNGLQNIVKRDPDRAKQSS